VGYQRLKLDAMVVAGPSEPAAGGSGTSGAAGSGSSYELRRQGSRSRVLQTPADAAALRRLVSARIDVARLPGCGEASGPSGGGLTAVAPRRLVVSLVSVNNSVPYPHQCGDTPVRRQTLPEEGVRAVLAVTSST
jgi:hypothetical protein